MCVSCQGRRPLDSKKKYIVGSQKSVTKPNAECPANFRRTFGARYGDLRRQNAQFSIHPLNLPFAGCLRVTMNFRKIGDTPMSDEFGSVKNIFSIGHFFEKYFFSTKKNRKIESKKKSSRLFFFAS